ncbi:TolC family outer membrane protein [Marinobacterium weihaiense]|uniref:TolC family outer membrane protein n=1 Tax=Marinobacterium weihaiense TaxID=2851016 RepID=A0ABS6M7R0_9GAMM|nr:TolC family outer membrane protein [Marinobacterium weihaiense]MBV0932313.1 TolC family outer membrane protein [Marinobacterium weihaiense]
MRRITRLIGYCSLALLAAGPAVADEAADVEPAPSDLWLLYQQAQEQDPRILTAEAAARRAEYQEREALGRLLPQVNADSRLTRTNYISGAYETYYGGERYSVSMSQVLYDSPVWQSYQRSRALSQQYAEQGEHDIQGATADLVQRYFDVLAAQDSLELIQAEKRSVERNLERVRSLFERQLAPITDKLEVEARLDRLRSDEIEARNNIWVTREALAEVIGRPVYEQLERLVAQPKLAQAFELESFEHWRDLALANSPLIQSKLASVDAQRAARKEAQGGHMPKISMQLSSQKSNIGNENSPSPRTESNVAALQIQIPIFSGGSTSARSDAAYESMLIARQELETVRRQVLKEVRTAYMNAESALAKVQAGKVALQSATKAREAAEKSFSYGINNAVDVLDRAREQYSAERDLLEAQYSFLLSYVVLKRWSGNLSEDDVQQINTLLDMHEVKYAAVEAAG